MYIQIHKSHEWRKILSTLSLAEFMSLIVFETQQEGAKSKSSDRNQGLLSFPAIQSESIETHDPPRSTRYTYQTSEPE